MVIEPNSGVRRWTWRTKSMHAQHTMTTSAIRCVHIFCDLIGKRVRIQRSHDTKTNIHRTSVLSSIQSLTHHQHPCTKVRRKIDREMTNATTHIDKRSICLSKTIDNKNIDTDEEIDEIGDTQCQEEDTSADVSHGFP